MSQEADGMNFDARSCTRFEVKVPKFLGERGLRKLYFHTCDMVVFWKLA